MESAHQAAKPICISPSLQACSFFADAKCRTAQNWLPRKSKQFINGMLIIMRGLSRDDILKCFPYACLRGSFFWLGGPLSELIPSSSFHPSNDCRLQRLGTHMSEWDIADRP
uniref:Uncharacterized protein n=1 Tax=Sphaerodactylus townsendi TaxID=933632 RepID=A0ACB8E9D5_9SAUR